MRITVTHGAWLIGSALRNAARLGKSDYGAYVRCVGVDMVV
jgi:hypothetical protein